MKHVLKSVLSLALVFALLAAGLPGELPGLLAARAEQSGFAPAVVPAGFDEVLARAEAGRDEGGERGQSGWRYVLLSPENYAVVTGYDGTADRELVMPDLLGGADVVGVAAGALAGLTGVAGVEIPGNVLAMGKNALPAGAVVRATSGAYAETWARKNGRAFATTSELQFNSGVVDFTGIRPENFLRVSAEEVWLRPLEAGRIRPGSLFFLADPANVYQISYYKAVDLSETRNGFVVVRCVTPDVDDILYYYEATDQPMMVDYSTLVLYDGAELISAPAARSGDASMSLNGELGVAFTPKIKLSETISIKVDVTYKVSYEASCKVGIFTRNEATIEQKEDAQIGVVFSAKTSTVNGPDLKDKMKDTVKDLAANHVKGKTNLTCPMGSAVIFSVYGILNFAASLSLDCELEGELSFKVKSSTTTTYTYKEGEDAGKNVRVHKRTFEGKAEGSIKAGVTLSAELYILAIKVLSVGVFAGVEIKATLDITEALDVLLNLPYIQEGTECYFDTGFNPNMVDCVEISVHFIVEIKIVLGATDALTFAKGRVRIADFCICEVHWHLLPFEWTQMELTSGETNPNRYLYRLGGNKRFFHLAEECPYDTKTVDFVLPQGNHTLKTYKDVLIGTKIADPEIDINLFYRRKLVAWHDSPSLDEESRVEWPYTIVGDTTFFAETVPMHKVHLIEASTRPMAIRTDWLGIYEEGKNIGVSYTERDGYVAEGEYLILPDETTEGVEIKKWIEVSNGFDYIPIGEEMEPGKDYYITDRNDDYYEVWLCGLTDQDIMANFYTGINQTLNAGTEDYVTSYARRGLGITAPECTRSIPGYAFRGWTDESGETVYQPGARIPTDANTDSVLSFYAKWEYDGTVSAEHLDSVAIGTMIPATGTKENDPAMFAWSLNADTGEATVTGFNYNSGETYAREWVEIPAYIEGHAVTGIAKEAFRGCQTLHFIVFPATVRTLGEGALRDCTNLQTIDLTQTAVTELPNYFATDCTVLQGVLFPVGQRITGIGTSAFNGCRAFSRVSIDADIGGSAFSGCTRLSAVTLGGGVTRIGSYAFNGCTRLAALALPDSITSIGDGFINGCTALRTLDLAGSVPTLTSQMMKIGSAGTVQTVVIGYGVQTINSATFTASNGYGGMTSITLPGSLKTIGASAFSGSGIASLTISFLGNVDISGAFSGCNSLKTVNVQSGRISAEAFMGLASLETVNIGSAVSTIGKDAFRSCPNLKTVTIAEGVTTIQESAFRDCPKLEGLTIPDTVYSLGNYIIFGDTGLKSLSVGLSLNRLTTATSAAYVFRVGADSALETLTIREGVFRVPYGAFGNGYYSSGWQGGFTNLETLTLPGTLISIGTYAFAGAGIRTLTLNNASQLASSAFEGCARLEEIVFNRGDIGDYAFRNSALLRKVVVRGGSIGAYAFASCPNLTEVELREGVVTVGDYAFAYCPALTTLTFPDSVTEYGRYLISGCSALTDLTIGGGVAELGSVNSNSNNRSFYIGPDSVLRSITLREGIRVLGDSMFNNQDGNSGDHGHTALRTVSFPASLERICGNAFSGSGLREVVLTGNVALDSYAFQYLPGLTRVKLADGTIGSYAFQSCTALASVDLGRVTSVGSYAFKNCSALKRLTVPDTVQTMSADALEGCTGLAYLSIGATLNSMSGRIPFDSDYAELELRDGVQIVPSDMFYANPGLAVVSFPKTLVSIGRDAFRNTGVRWVRLPGSVDVGDYAFADCTSLTEVYIDELIGSGSYDSCIFSGDTQLRRAVILAGELPDRIFSECRNLIDVQLGDAVTSIGNSAFSGCRRLYSLSIPDSVVSLGTWIIYGCVNLHELRVGGGVSSISYRNFSVGPDAKLTYVSLSEGVKTLGEYAFANARGTYASERVYGFPDLTWISFPGSLTSVGSYVIAGSAVDTIFLPGTVSVGGSAFRGLSDLRYAILGGGTVGDSAFMDCRNLVCVDLREGVTAIFGDAFRNCAALASLYIPASVTTFGDTYNGPLLGCAGLKSVSVGKGFNNWSKKAYLCQLGQGSALRSIEFREGVTQIPEGTFANYADNTSYGLPNVETITLPQTVTNIADRNLRYVPNLRHLYLRYGATIVETGDVPRSLTLYTDYYNPKIDDFAIAHNLRYVVRLEDEMPVFRLIRVVLADLVSARGLPVSDGTLPVTRGAGGEAALLPEGYAVLSDQQIAFTEPLELEDPPVGEGMVFYGWYTDPEFTVPWTSEIMLANDVTLYARVEPAVTVTYAVPLASLGAADSRLPDGYYAYASYQLRAGDELPVPPEPAPTGYVFGGWYTDADYGFAAHASVAPDGDTVLYGRLDRISAGGRYEPVEGGVRLTRYALEEDESPAVRLPARVNGEPLVSIASGAFTGSGVLTLHIPDSVTQIDEGTFHGSDLRAVTVSAGNPAYSGSGGVLYDKDRTVLLYHPAHLSRSSTSFSLPGTVVRIGAYAFAGDTRLSSVSFAGVREIGAYAFEGCTGFYTVTLPDTTQTLEAGAFKGCANLRTFRAYGLTRIDTGAADGRSGRVETLPTHPGLSVFGPVGEGVLRDYYLYTDSNGRQYTLNYNQYPLYVYIGSQREDMYCEAGALLPDSLRDVLLEDGTVVNGWYRDSGFTTAWDLDSDVMPSSTQYIYASATRLLEATDAGYTTVTVDGVGYKGYVLSAWNGRTSTLVLTDYYGQVIVGLADGFLAGAAHLDSVTIPASVVSIADGALTCADGSLPGCIVADADSAAAAWAEAHGVDFCPLAYALSFETYGEPLNDLSAPKGALLALPTPVRAGREFSGWYTDARLYSTTAVTLDENGLYAMPGQPVRLYAAWAGEDEVVPYTWTAADRRVTITAYTGEAARVVIPETINGWPVVAIGDRAFAGTGVYSVATAGVTEIGEGAFENCAFLASASLPAVTAIGADAFAGCGNLHACALPETLVSIGDRAFAGTALGSVSIPDGVTRLGGGVFADCAGLRAVTVGSGVEALGPDQFAGCARLAQISVTAANPAYRTLDGVLFSADGKTLVLYPAARAAADYTVPAGATAIGADAFANAAALGGIDLNNVQRIGKAAFAGCTGLCDVDLSGVTALGAGAFFGCGGLRTVRLGAGLADLGGFAFVNCDGLAEVVVPAAVELDLDEVYFDASGATLVGTVGSSAQAYAAEYGLNFTDPNATAATALTLSETELTLERGATVTLAAQITPADAQIGADIRWYSSNEAVAVVEDGRVRALAGGTATILARSENGLEAACALTVRVTLQAIRPSVLAPLAVGQQAAISVTLVPEHATDTTLAWSSADPDVAAVDENGVVTALALGHTAITVTAGNGVSEEIPVEVYTPAESFSLTAPAQTLYLVEGGDTLRLTAEVLPENATYRNFDFVSSNDAVATVDANGLVTARGTGSVTITAISQDPAAQIRTCDLTVSLLPIAESMLRGERTAAYTGDSIHPGLWLEYAGHSLTGNYACSYGEIREPGVYPVTFTGEQLCSGSFTVDFTVLAPAVHIYDAIRLLPGQSGRLPVSADGGATAFTYASSDTGVFTVGADGLVTAVGEGTAVLTVTAGELTGACGVTVGGFEHAMTLPAALREIGEEAFAGDESAQCLTLGDKAETIGARAFADMPALELIELPGSVKTIADDAFAGSDPLIVCPKGSAAEAFAIGHGLRYFSR